MCVAFLVPVCIDKHVATQIMQIYLYLVMVWLKRSRHTLNKVYFLMHTQTLVFLVFRNVARMPLNVRFGQSPSLCFLPLCLSLPSLFSWHTFTGSPPPQSSLILLWFSWPESPLPPFLSLFNLLLYHVCVCVCPYPSLCSARLKLSRKHRLGWLHPYSIDTFR